jgi:hypothetical protein
MGLPVKSMGRTWAWVRYRSASTGAARITRSSCSPPDGHRAAEQVRDAAEHLLLDEVLVADAVGNATAR